MINPSEKLQLLFLERCQTNDLDNLKNPTLKVKLLALKKIKEDYWFTKESRIKFIEEFQMFQDKRDQKLRKAIGETLYKIYKQRD